MCVCIGGGRGMWVYVCMGELDVGIHVYWGG